MPLPPVPPPLGKSTAK